MSVAVSKPVVKPIFSDLTLHGCLMVTSTVAGGLIGYYENRHQKDRWELTFRESLEGTAIGALPAASELLRHALDKHFPNRKTTRGEAAPRVPSAELLISS